MQHLFDFYKKKGDIIDLGEIMKNQKAVFIVCLLIIIVLIAGILIAGYKKRNELKEREKLAATSKFTITYSYGGGFGTIEQVVTKQVSIDQDGNIVFSVPKHDEIEPVRYTMTKKNAKALYSLLMSKGFMELDEDLSRDDVMDAGSSYIRIQNDNMDRTIGGYAAFLDKKYSKLTGEIVNEVGVERISAFTDKVEKELKISYES